MKKRSRKSSLSKSSVSQHYSKLEPRQLLAITLVDTFVEIEGTLGDDVVTVTSEPGPTNVEIIVTLNDETQIFDKSDVERIRFRALQGDDSFTNMTDIDSTAYGHSGDDVFIGGDGHNRFQGGDGRDELIGGPKNDVLRGRDGNDIINGKQRHDRLFGGNGQDQIDGEQGRDFIKGEAGDDILTGGNLEDRIFGEGGDDEIRGGTGDDHLVGGGGNDRIEGGDGIDKLIGNVGMDSLSGGDGNDELRGGDGDDVLSGDDGADLINGHEGDDLIVGGDGRDTADGGEGNDRIFGGDGPDILRGGDGRDEIHGNEGVDVINGGFDKDTLYGGVDAADIFQGGNDVDLILAGSKSDSVVDGADDIVIEFGEELIAPGSRWTDAHILNVGGSLNSILERTNRSVLMGDSTSSNVVRYVKGTDLEPGSSRDPDGVLVIQLADWDTSDGSEQRNTNSEIIYQAGLVWSDPATVDSIFGGSGDFLTQFWEVSDWTEGDEVPDGYVASTDGEWYYLEDAEFFTERGRENPSSDWANMWVYAFSDIKNPLDTIRLADKIEALDSFFDSV